MSPLTIRVLLPTTTSQSETLPGLHPGIPGRVHLLNAFSFFRHHLLCRSAAWQFEAGDARLPACRTGGLAGSRVVFIDIPEGAVIHRIEIEGGVVSPARIRCGLHARS